MDNLHKESIPSFDHPEWAKENSLTAKEDRTTTPANPWRPDLQNVVLSEEEVKNAMTDLNKTAFIARFPRLDRTYADPAILDQKYGLISFTPAKGAQPNKAGVYGYAKLRGNYATPIETNQRAEYLIRNVDSYHQIYHAFVGRPFPLTNDSKYSAEISEIDLRKDMSESISTDVKQKKEKEKNEIEEIKRREKALVESSRKSIENDERLAAGGSIEEKVSVDDQYENYITLKVKKAQLTWTYLEHKKKMAEIKNIVVETVLSIDKLDLEQPSFKDKYFEKYMTARKEAGILNEMLEETQGNFMKYMVEDAVIPEIDELLEQKRKE
jgi:hypothetical protein